MAHASYDTLKFEIVSTGTNDSYDTIAEIEVRETYGGTNVATSATATATSVYPGRPTTALNDADNTNQWSNNGGAPTAYPHFVQLAWASPITPREVVFYFHNSSDGRTRAPTVVDVKGSTGGGAFTTLGRWYLGGGVASGGSLKYYIPDPADTAPTFVRVRATTTGDGYLALSGVNIYGTIGGTDVAATSAANASSLFGGGTDTTYLAANTIDANINTLYHSASGMPQVLYYQLQSGLSYVERVTLVARNNSEYYRAPTAFSVDTSLDGDPSGTWTNQFTVTGAAAWASAAQSRDFDNPNPPPAAGGGGLTNTRIRLGIGLGL